LKKEQKRGFESPFCGIYNKKKLKKEDLEKLKRKIKRKKPQRKKS